MRILRWESGKIRLELAPAHMSERSAERVLANAFDVEPGSLEVAEMLAERRYALTGDWRAIEEWETEYLQPA